MELEALQAIDSEVRGLGARIVTLTPEFERYTRDVHKKLNLTFDILTDLHLNTAEQFGLMFVLLDDLRDLYRSASRWTGSMAKRNTAYRCRHATWSTRKGSFVQPM